LADMRGNKLTARETVLLEKLGLYDSMSFKLENIEEHADEEEEDDRTDKNKEHIIGIPNLRAFLRGKITQKIWVSVLILSIVRGPEQLQR